MISNSAQIMAASGDDCRVAVYGCGGEGTGGAADVAWKMGRIMLRFRPIAPKPAVAGAGPADEPLAGSWARGGSDRKPKSKGGFSGVGSKGAKTRKTKMASPTTSSSSGASSNSSSSVVTLPLITENSRRKEQKIELTGPPPSPPTVMQYVPSWPLWLRRPSSEVVVTLECVTDTWRDGDSVAAATVVAVSEALQKDDGCPAFVTDQCDRVTWTNDAYRSVVAAVPKEEDEVVNTALVTRGMVPAAGTCRAFVCRVHVRYASRRRGKGSLAAPCDVWMLDDGRCGWRLDMTAALSLMNNNI